MDYPILSTLAESEVIQVIHTRVAVGEVRIGDAPRVVHLYYSPNGDLLAYFDPYAGPLTSEIQSGVARFCRETVRSQLDEFDVAYREVTLDVSGS